MLRHHWFIRARWLITGGLFALFIGDRLLDRGFDRPAAVAWCIALLAAVNVLWTMAAEKLLKDAGREDERNPALDRRAAFFAHAQMTTDLLALTVILRYTGGIENPMAIFYLFHVMIAALLLGAPRALLQGVWAVGLYTALGVGECAGWITPHYPFLSPTASAYSDWVFVLTGIGVLGAGVFGILYFATQISSRLEEQEAELQESNLAVRNKRDAIAQLQERRSRFMRTAAHQLKSPLTGIEMLAGLIRDKVVPVPKIQDVISRIIGRCRQALGQVNELLTLERIEQAAPVRHRASRTDVAQVVLRVGQRFAEQAESQHVTLHVHADERQGLQAAVVECDLEDCMANLIENAIKYTPAEGRIDVTTSHDETTVSVSVRDNGIGIAQPDRDELFEPFRRGHEALAADLPGTGLGLAIVKEVVEQAGGRVELQSTLGKGTEFVVTFARCDSDNRRSAQDETDRALRDHPAHCIG